MSAPLDDACAALRALAMTRGEGWVTLFVDIDGRVTITGGGAFPSWSVRASVGASDHPSPTVALEAL